MKVRVHVGGLWNDSSHGWGQRLEVVRIGGGTNSSLRLRR